MKEHMVTKLLAKTITLLVLAFGLWNNLYSQVRSDVLISQDWKFTRENPKSAQSVKYNDVYWTAINLPHTWNNLDGQDGGSDYYRGIGWYRKKLTLESSVKNKMIYLKFDAVSTSAEVYCNGELVGTHKGGFAAFCFNITKFVDFGKENIIAVKVSNVKDSTISPLRGDFTVFGGIYRKVHLLVLDSVSVSPLDYASSGIYIRQKSVTEQQGDIEVTSVIENNTSNSQTIELQYAIVDKEGKVVDRLQRTTQIDSIPRTFIKQSFSIKAPHLWNGKNEPYEYSLEVQVRKSGKEIDAVKQNFGLRYFSVDPDKGFFLNGTHYPLHGINRHQDRENMGWAITEKEHSEDMALIEEIGATTIRLCHYQHDQYFYNLCDEKGMVVWAELALVDDINPCPEFAAVCKQQLTELIKQNINHPSVFFWSLENELIPDEMPDVYSKLIKDLNSLAKQLDSTRLTTVATRSKYDCNEGINSQADVIGLNVYRGWYEKMPEDFADYVDKQHKMFPQKPLAVSEYGAGASIYQHEDPTSKPAPRGSWHPEEWQSYLHEITWDAMNQRPYLWGTFIWNMFDFAVDTRSEGDTPGRNDKGLVTYDRKVKKDAFYFYKSNWNPEPMVYITSRRFVNRTSSMANIKVYSNCGSVNLFVNDVPVKIDKISGTVFQSNNVKLAEGKNVIRAEAVSAGKRITDTCEWQFGQKEKKTQKLKNK